MTILSALRPHDHTVLVFRAKDPKFPCRSYDTCGRCGKRLKVYQSRCIHYRCRDKGRVVSVCPVKP